MKIEMHFANSAYLVSIQLLLISFLIISKVAYGQEMNLNCIRVDSHGIQSALLLDNIDNQFVLNGNSLEIEQDQNAILYPKLTVSADFDNDGFTETAMFYDYDYHPNQKSWFTGSKIVLFKQLGSTIVPIGSWFSELKSDFDLDKVKFLRVVTIMEMENQILLCFSIIRVLIYSPSLFLNQQELIFLIKKYIIRCRARTSILID